MRSIYLRVLVASFGRFGLFGWPLQLVSSVGLFSWHSLVLQREVLRFIRLYSLIIHRAELGELGEF